MKTSLANNGSSSEDEDELDERNILDSLYKHYGNAKTTHLGNTSSHLENVLQSGAATCLICIRSVRRNTAIWCCRDCYCLFHLDCIRTWANDSLLQQRKKLSQQENDRGHYNYMGEYVPPKARQEAQWLCPLCRRAYGAAETPKEYVCFCGKTLNPEQQPFLVPHSCGEICNKPLQPDCGHSCKLLCHPGPCPPCAQYANVSCLCGRSAKTMVRCSQKAWQCGAICQNPLSCGHQCKQACHEPNKCQPCAGTSLQPCQCGREQKQRKCVERNWRCARICGASYSCGLHVCNKVCHAGGCGECPLGQRQTCPCGKIGKVSSCTDVIEPCGDTCQKLLPCGLHSCTQRCHFGDCEQCLVIIKKKCRCGQREKELPCSKEFACDMKCKKLRECGKHACNRKCCFDDCPPCEKICGKQLQCNKHKCQSVCHNGPCFPCRLQSQINCFCGKTSKSVPCGRERKARIVCLERCRLSSKCHHPTHHRCHKGACPPCNARCALPNDTTNCGHECDAKCHAAVRQINRNVPNNGTLTKDHMKYEYVKLPHPKCARRVEVRCIGGHELAEWPCWDSKPKSCLRKCNRALKCGNHTCQLVCHVVEDPTNMDAQDGCSKCEEPCQIPRAAGCLHPCTRGCHKPPCAKCQMVIKTKCHCGLNQVIYKCSEFFNDTVAAAELAGIHERLKSCGNRCLKNYACGHRCAAICHSGECPNPETCRKKVRVFCSCKRLKQDVACDRHRAGQTSLACNDDCAVVNAQLTNAETLKQTELDRQEELRNRAELEQFEKKFGKRKQRERKCVTQKPKQTRDWTFVLACAGLLLVILIAVCIALYAEN